MTELTRDQQELARQIQNQRQRFQWSLNQTQAYLQTLDLTVRDLPRQVQQLRQTQHPYDPDLEEAQSLVEQWQQQRDLFFRQVEDGGGRLESAYRMIHGFDMSSANWLTESQVSAKLQGELRDLEDILAQILRWQKQILSDLGIFTQKASAISRIVRTRLGAREFLQTASFASDPTEVPMGAFSLICPHWGPSEQVPVFLFISDRRIVLESQQTEEQRGMTRFGSYEAARDRKLLQQWPMATVHQIERVPEDQTAGAAADQMRERVTIQFDDSDPDVLVEQVQVSCEAREAVNIVDTLYRAQHPKAFQHERRTDTVQRATPDSTPNSDARTASGLTPAEIEQKIQKIEDALLEGRIGEQTYRELKQKYENMG